MANEVVLVVFVSFVVTLIALFFARRILTALDVVDVPNHRSSHSNTTLRGAGFAPLCGVIAGAVCSFFLGSSDFRILALVLVPAILVAIVGLIEDLHGLSMKARLLSQLVIGVLAGFMFNNSSAHPLVWMFFVTIGFAAYINFTNFMDGVNGISGFHGIVVGLTFGYYGLTTSIVWLQTAGLIVSAVFLAFIPFNFRKPGMFLGDVGSYLLGGVIGAIAISAFSNGIHWFALLAPVSIYLTDTLFTIVSRKLAGESITEAHRSHIYQKLNKQGLTHLQVSLTVAAFTLASSLIGILFLRDILDLSFSVILLICTCILYIFLPLLRRRDFRG
ncbi:MraY family glycosyltransferase [Corynebacterium glutamicum]|uniref:MraY family glycosyltransferase n=1 Tax=Corynebacterium glutamicum TaxID=1718 RepID=UPI003C7C9130